MRLEGMEDNPLLELVLQPRSVSQAEAEQPAVPRGSGHSGITLPGFFAALGARLAAMTATAVCKLTFQ